MTNPTPHGQVPEALLHASYLESIFVSEEMSSSRACRIAKELRRLHAYCQELESQFIRDCMTHDQKPAEIEHVAGDVSKNGTEVNTSGAVLTHKQAVGSKNCMQCCVSYMLGLPLESVPDFATDGGWELFSEFVESKGYAAVMLPGNHEFEADYLASGTTERGTSHMVVMNDGKLVHDPHPSNAGLVEVQCVWLLAKRATPRAVHADEQAAFEAVAKADTSNVSFVRDDTGYVDMTAALLWHGWKLRASHGQAPAQAAPAAAAGWKLAPVEPTDAMVQAAHHIDLSYMPGQEGADRAAIYRAMLAVAPTPPTQAADSALKDHQIAALVNELRDIAVEFHGTQQLRERIARAVIPALKAQATDSVLEDAARYRYLRDGDWREHDKLESIIRLQLNSLWDAAIDAARKQGGA